MDAELTTPPKSIEDRPTPDESDHEDETSPTDQIEQFDWQELEDSYLQAMADRKTEEDKLLEHFQSLSQYFGVWAETISGHEQHRSHTRLNTQTALVRKQEEDLEALRQHYVQVVTAFQKALALLNG